VSDRGVAIGAVRDATKARPSSSSRRFNRDSVRQAAAWRGREHGSWRRCGVSLITLTFRPVHGESPMLVRGMHFRICADATLRGSDNEIAAVYTKRLWQLGSRQYRTFECGGPIYLRVTHRAGSREHLGPYAFLKATEGAIFTHDNCLGVHAPLPDAGASADVWQEIAFLSTL